MSGVHGEDGHFESPAAEELRRTYEGMARPRNQRPAPSVGSRWRARRKGEEARTVEVIDYDGGRFVWTITLTNTRGEAPQRPVKSRLLLGEFHYAFDPLDIEAPSHPGSSRDPEAVT